VLALSSSCTALVLLLSWNIVRYNTSTNHSKCWRIFALSCYLLNLKHLIVWILNLSILVIW
jgi:hypothetical protein